MKSLWPDESHEPEAAEPLTNQQANVLRQKLGSVRLEVFVIKVLVWQSVTAVLIGLTAGLLWDSWATAVSGFYGAMCAVFPAALVAFVVFRRMSTGALRRSGDMLVGLFVLELIKVATSVLLLAAAPLVLGPPQWVPLVIGFVLTLKIYWLVALLGSRQTTAVHTLR